MNKKKKITPFPMKMKNVRQNTHKKRKKKKKKKIRKPLIVKLRLYFLKEKRTMS